MKPLIFNAVSTCFESIFLPAFKSTPVVPSRQRFSVLLTSKAACTRNTDEYVGRTHSRSGRLHKYPAGQQVFRSGQQTAISPNGQQAYVPFDLRQHFCSGQ